MQWYNIINFDNEMIHILLNNVTISLVDNRLKYLYTFTFNFANFKWSNSLCELFFLQQRIYTKQDGWAGTQKNKNSHICRKTLLIIVLSLETLFE